MTPDPLTNQSEWQESIAESQESEWVRISRYLDHLDLPQEGKSYVLKVISSPPCRKVGIHRNRNLIADIPIPRLGVVLQAESGSGEYFFLIEESRKK
jgi:hypothetical protein